MLRLSFIETMARAIADVEGKYLEKEFNDRLYRRMVQLGQDSRLRLEARYAPLFLPQEEREKAPEPTPTEQQMKEEFGLL